MTERLRWILQGGSADVAPLPGTVNDAWAGLLFS